MSQKIKELMSIIVCLFIIVITLTLFALGSGEQSATNSSVKNTVRHFDRSVDNKQDIEKLSSYHKQMLKVLNPLDEAYNRYTRESSAAVKKGDLYALYDAAGELKAAAESSMIVNIQAPELNNIIANKDIQKASEALRNYESSIAVIAGDVMEMANEGPTPKRSYAIKETTEFMQASSFILAANLISAYNALGCDINKIDTKNGGLTNEKPDEPQTKQQ